MQPKTKTELDFLTAVERGDVVTQMALSKRVGVAVGLINALLKRAARKGYVKAKSAPYKRYAYYLTPKGFGEKSRLVAEYLEVSLDFFRQARGEYVELFAGAEARGLKRLALVGGGELAEIAAMAAHDGQVELVAIVDTKTNRERLYGIRVVRGLDD
jgi:DNA-binding MarR family transcriptional regulator